MPKLPAEPVMVATWVLQAEASARTGYSVSAIRKWRRAGLIADRRQVGPRGVERVEVRLEDVEARMALHPPAPARAEPRPATPDPAPSPLVKPGAAPTAAPGAGGTSPVPETILRPPADGPPAAVAPVVVAVSAGGDHQAGPPAGNATIPIADLEGLFRRLSDTERRAEQAESRLKEAVVEARYMSGQLAELRRQVQAAATPAPVEHRATERGPSMAAGNGAAIRPPAPTPVSGPPVLRPSRPEARPRVFDVVTLETAPGGPASSPATSPVLRSADAATSVRPPAHGPTRPEPATRSATSLTSGSQSAETNGRPARPRARPEAEREAEADPANRIDDLALELRRLYARLDEYRREPTISPVRERQRERDLDEYDTVLLRACSALSIPVGLRPGQPVTLERRGALTQALARAGLDVRVKPKGRVGG